MDLKITDFLRKVRKSFADLGVEALRALGSAVFGV